MLIGDLTIPQVISGVIVLYISFILFAYIFADRVAFLFTRSSYKNFDNIINIRIDDNAAVTALYLPNPQAKYTVLFSHGNAEDIGDMRYWMSEYRAAGFSILAWDYRGYGQSTGTVWESNFYSDAELFYDYLVNELNVEPENIIVHGRSIGGAAAMHLAANKKVAGLILESTFISLFRAAWKPRFLPVDRYKNLDKITSVESPILVIHGKRDRIVGFWHSQKLFDKAPDPKQCYWVDQAGHNNLYLVTGDEYWKKLTDFAKLIDQQGD